nr:hypothetical protein [Brevibacillus laterosporus]
MYGLSKKMEQQLLVANIGLTMLELPHQFPISHPKKVGEIVSALRIESGLE